MHVEHDRACLHISATQPVVAEDPCQPNPCGSNSNRPRNLGNRCDCSCLPNMVGSPPNCRPECIFNNDCPSDKACQRQRCLDPCPNLCGSNANCRVRNHIPICVCQAGYIGDPFNGCHPTTSKFIFLPARRNPPPGSHFPLLVCSHLSSY